MSVEITSDRGNGAFDGVRRLDDVLIPINDEYPSVALTDGEGRRSMVGTGACGSMHTLLYHALLFEAPFLSE
jgi:hypothetical protein